MKRWTAIFTLVLGLVGAAVAWPAVSSSAGTPGKWTDDYSGTRAEAQRQKLPVLLAIVDTRLSMPTHIWNTNVLESVEWREWLDSTKMLLVWWDHEKINRKQWEAVAMQFAQAGSLAIPQIVVFDPTGCKADQFCAINRGNSRLADPDGFIGRLDESVGEWPDIQTGPGTIGFTTNAVSVRVGTASASLTVRRHGGDSSGRQAFLLETVALTNANAAVANIHYTSVATNLIWEAGDASERKIDIPLQAVEGWAQPYDRAFGVTLTKDTASTAKTGITNLTVTITSDFSASDGWVANTNDWHVWEAGRFTNNVPAELTWTAPQPGLLTFTGGQTETNDVFKLTLPSSTGNNPLIPGLDTNETLSATNTIAMTTGERLTWTASGTNGTFWVEMLDWQPLSAPQPSSPANGGSFQLQEVMANTNLLDLIWNNAATNSGTYCLLFTGRTSNALSPVTNAVSGVSAAAWGFTDGTYYWSVANVATGDLNTAVSAASPVWSFEVTERPVLTAPTRVSFYLGVPSAFAVLAQSAFPVEYSASGLPSGLKIDKTTGVVSGTATRQGTFNVTVKATSSKGTASLPVTIVVEPLSAYISGTLQGFVTDVAGTVRGVFTMTVAKSGKPSLKTEIDGKRKTLRGAWQDTSKADALIVTFSDRTMSLDLTVSGDTAIGHTSDGLRMEARRILSGATAKPYVGYYTVMLDAQVTETGALNNTPEGSGYLTFTVTERNGSVKYSGKLADGTSVSGSAGLIAISAGEAMFPVYKPLYSRRGAVAALAVISQSAMNAVGTTGGTWLYPGKKAMPTDDAFGAELSGLGAVYVKKGASLKWLEGAVLNVDGNPIANLSATDKKVTVTGADGTRLSVAAATGLFTGSFRDTMNKSRPIKGVLVPARKLGAGYWLMPDTSVPQLRFNRSHAVEIDAP